jgi:hypothetical protein
MRKTYIHINTSTIVVFEINEKKLIQRSRLCDIQIHVLNIDKEIFEEADIVTWNSRFESLKRYINIASFLDPQSCSQ